MYVLVCECVCLCGVYVRLCMRVCARVSAFMCAGVCVYVCACAWVYVLVPDSGMAYSDSSAGHTESPSTLTQLIPLKGNDRADGDFMGFRLCD